LADRTLVLIPTSNDQVFQNWIFVIHGHDELLQTRNRHAKADATDAIALLESKDCSLFVFCGDVVNSSNVVDDSVDDEWKER
jgi:hypothetical protein